MQEQTFTPEQLQQLEKPLDPRLISTRQGGGSTTLKYIEGHDAIDSANRIFGYGGWSYRPLSCVQTVLLDPITGEPVGITYKAQVEVTVRGCAPIVDVGSQPVATWNVEDQVLKTRLSSAKYNKKPVDTSPTNPSEIAKARGVIVDAHEMAEKGAVTDALKRALRVFGDQFGNGLYGDGRVVIEDEQPNDQQQETKKPGAAQQKQSTKPTSVPTPTQELYKKGGIKHLWTDRISFYAFASACLAPVVVTAEYRLSAEEIAQLNAIVDKENAKSA